jgi:hypothetical protein
VLAPWEYAGYQLILSVPVVPNPPAIKSYSGPPEPGGKPYQLVNYPDVVAALQQGAAVGARLAEMLPSLCWLLLRYGGYHPG